MGSVRGVDVEFFGRDDLLRPTKTNALSRRKSQAARLLREVDHVRDEEAVGSNPATPTK
jgi:hypothetical protein